MDVAIIDYKMSNLYSVQSACNNAGLSSIITSDTDQIQNAKIAILPGVGAFGQAIHHIRELELDKAIYNFIDSGKPFIGICLGLHLLFDKSAEFGMHKGLGVIPGDVKKFKLNSNSKGKYPVPQIGWNKLFKGVKKWGNTLLCNNESGDFMYFVHSYYVEPLNSNDILAVTKYGGQEYCSAIQQDNVFASQFHPEKSGQCGLKIYNNILRIINNDA